MPVPSPSDLSTITTTLYQTRVGKATLAQMATAHDLAEAAGLTATTEELKGHIRRRVAKPPVAPEVKSVALGIVSGMITSAMLGHL